MEKLGEYPVWCVLYFSQVLQPMLGVAAVATKILVKSGKARRKRAAAGRGRGGSTTRWHTACACEIGPEGPVERCEMQRGSS